MKLLMGPSRVVSLELKTLLSSSEFQGIWELQKPRSKRQNIRKRKIFLPLLAVVFPVIMNGSESCTIKKTEYWRINAFELWCWRRLLRVICTARRSNQWVLKEINPECSLEGLILKLKLQYFGHLMRRADSKIQCKRRRGQQRTRWLDSITDSVDMALSKFCEIVEDRGAWCAAVHRVTKSWTPQWLNNNY